MTSPLPNSASPDTTGGPARPSTTPSPVRILLIEDEPADALRIDKLLRDAAAFPIELRKAGRLADGLHALAEEPTDVILLDLTLPDTTGFEGLIQAAERAPGTPVLVLGGEADLDFAVQAAVYGADDFLVKNQLTETVLARTVHYALERRRARRALAASEERYRRLFMEGLTGDFLATPGGQILDCNPAFAALFGFASVTESKQAVLPDLLPDRDQRREILRLLRRGGKAERVEIQGRRVDGKALHLVCNVTGGLDRKGRLKELHGYLFDDTERRQAAHRLRLAGRMEAVGQLAGGIAHDFNNLITVITGYSELLLARLDADDPKRREIQEIQGAGQRAAELTRQLLAFSRRQVMQPELLDLNAIVREAGSMLRPLIGEDIELVIRPADDLAPILADPGQVHQVIVNLAINARDAMPEGGLLVVETANVELDASYHKQRDVVPAGSYVMLAVSDTGHGMDEDTRAQVFEPFFTTKASGKGTGLGLSTAYGIVKQSGGFIWVYSEPGEGTTFKVYLPRAEESMPAPRQPVATERPSTGTETILIVEDSDAVRVLVGEMLEPRGYSVLSAATGKEALAICGDPERRIDLLISDVVMPDVRGPELQQRIAALRPGLPCLFISGYAGGAAEGRGTVALGAPFLEKPFSADTLAAKVREILDRDTG
jgi:two-component system, cell cycle sensor histidine kinase and response regulator CckA